MTTFGGPPAPCPLNACSGTMYVDVDLPEGTYPCVCQACIVRLTWPTLPDGTREPHLALVSRAAVGGAT